MVVDVLIVGGGVIGLSAAYRLARRGLRVRVLDRGELGREASWAGAGIIPPGNSQRAASALDRLRAVGAEQFPIWSQELHELTGIDNEYHVCDGIEFLPPDETSTLARWQAEGLTVLPYPLSRKWLAEVANLRPYFLLDFAQVRNPRHLQALIAACTKLGVELCPNTGFDRWLTDGVRDERGQPHGARHVIIAAGAWSTGILGQLGVKVPVQPVRGQILLYQGLAGLVPHIVQVGKRYIVPRRDGHVLIGSTEEPEAGFEKGNTVAGLSELRAFALGTIPGLRDAVEVSAWSGLRPGSPDGWPIIGTHPTRRNLHFAVGHYRAGVQLSPGTALLLESLVTGSPAPVPLEPFCLNSTTDRHIPPAFRS
ncbi:MAG: NAD(P)/FAD-dependent oxidoreductase [Fimbriiglobus sp.]